MAAYLGQHLRNIRTPHSCTHHPFRLSSTSLRPSRAQVRFLARGFSAPGDHAGQTSHGLRWPFGPVALITPFNFPLEIPALQLMGALYMGNKPLLHVDQKVVGGGVARGRAVRTIVRGACGGCGCVSTWQRSCSYGHVSGSCATAAVWLQCGSCAEASYHA